MIGFMISESGVPYYVMASAEATALYLGSHTLVEPLTDWEDLEAKLLPVKLGDGWLLLVAVVSEATVYVLNPNEYNTECPSRGLLEWLQRQEAWPMCWVLVRSRVAPTETADVAGVCTAMYMIIIARGGAVSGLVHRISSRSAVVKASASVWHRSCGV